jgi:hypothetical protein
MTCLRHNGDWCDVARKNKLIVPFAVENKEELMFRMGCADAFKRLISKPTNALELVFNEQAGINSNSQFVNFLMVRNRLVVETKNELIQYICTKLLFLGLHRQKSILKILSGHIICRKSSCRT